MNNNVMSMKLILNAHACGYASAVVTGIVYVLCIFMFILTPGLAFSFGKMLLHGVEMSSQVSITWMSAIGGLIFWLILSYVTGWLFAVIYNNSLKEEAQK